MSSRLSNQAEISNVDSPPKASFVRSIEDLAQRDVLEQLVDPKLVWIKDHIRCR